MEEIDGMFSSPEKSPEKARTNGYANDTINSEDMETGDSMYMYTYILLVDIHQKLTVTYRQHSRAI